MSNPDRLPTRKGADDAQPTRRRAISKDSPSGTQNPVAHSRSRTTSGPKQAPSAGPFHRTPLDAFAPNSSRPFTSLRYNGREAYHVPTPGADPSLTRPTRPTVQIPESRPEAYAVIGTRAFEPFGTDSPEQVVEIPARAPYNLKGVHVTLREWSAGPPGLWKDDNLLAGHYQRLESRHIPCAYGCFHLFHREQSELFTLEADFPAYIAKLRSIVRVACPKCAMYTCLVCGEVDILERTGSEDSDTWPEGPVLRLFSDSAWDSDTCERGAQFIHCPDLQALIIGMGLMMIDQTCYQFDDRPSALIGAVSRKRPRDPAVDSDSETKPPGKAPRLDEPGNTEAVDASTAAGGLLPSLSPSRGTARPRPARPASALDMDGETRVAHQEVSILLRQLLPYLPHSDRPGGTWMPDRYPHATVLEHFRRRGGFILDLMRVSTSHIRANKELHHRVFRHLQNSLANERGPLLDGPIWRRVRRQRSNGALDTASNDTWIEVPNDEELTNLYYERVNEAASASPMSRRFSSAPLDGRERTRRWLARLPTLDYHDEGRGVEDDDLIGMSSDEHDSASGEDAVRGLPGLSASPTRPAMSTSQGNVTTATSEEYRSEVYKAWAARACFRFCSLFPVAKQNNMESLVVHDHAGRVAFEQTLRVPFVPPWMPRSVKRDAVERDLASLCQASPSGHPSGIFVRPDSWRWDCMRALIIGPPGTPYENGCFVFDIRLPEAYPRQPPLVRLGMATGGFQLSPYLHPYRPVHLDLLNTTGRPAWRPGTSSLLDVLLDIQTNILRSQPLVGFFNPEALPDDSEPYLKVGAYNAFIRRVVLSYAICTNLENPPYPFQKEIRQHFRLRSPSIRRQLGTWHALDNAMRANGQVPPTVPYDRPFLSSLGDLIIKTISALDVLDAEGPSVEHDV